MSERRSDAPAFYRQPRAPQPCPTCGYTYDMGPSAAMPCPQCTDAAWDAGRVDVARARPALRAALAHELAQDALRLWRKVTRTIH